MLQIIAKRIDKKTKKVVFSPVKNDQLPPLRSIQDIFQGIDSILRAIPKEEHHDLYYTAYHLTSDYNALKNKDEAVIEKMEIVPFRITNIQGFKGTDVEAFHVASLVADELKADPNLFGIMVTKNAYEVLLMLEKPYTESDWLDLRPHYEVTINNMQIRLRAQDFPGCIVENLWRKDTLLTLPKSIEGDDEISP